MNMTKILFAQVVEAFAAEGYPHDVIGQWTLPENDADDLVQSVVQRQPERVLEVGTFVGFSTMLIALAGGSRVHVTTVDPNLPLVTEMQSMGSIFAKVDAGRPTQEVARSVATRLGIADRITFVAGGFSSGSTFASRRVEPALSVPVVGPEICAKNEPFDLAFIDGLHFADAVSADLNLVHNSIRAGGAILMHDCIGMWGTNVRTGISDFLATHENWCFLHRPYAELYRSIGTLVRRDDMDAVFIEGLAGDPVIPTGLAAWFSPLLTITADSVSAHRIVELTNNTPVVTSLVPLSIPIETLRFDKKSLDRMATELEKGGPRPFLTSVGAIDCVPDVLVNRLFEIMNDYCLTGLFLRTPPGEFKAACRYSRPLRRWLSLASAHQLTLHDANMLDIAPSRFSFVKRGSAAAFPTSALISPILIMPANRSEVGNNLNLRAITITSESAHSIEQNLLLDVHYAVGFQRQFADHDALFESNTLQREAISKSIADISGLKNKIDSILAHSASIQTKLDASEDNIGALHADLSSTQEKLAIAQAESAAQKRARIRLQFPLVDNALSHAASRNFNNPVLVLDVGQDASVIDAILFAPGVAGIAPAIRHSSGIFESYADDSRVGRYDPLTRQWVLPGAANTVYFFGPPNRLSRSMLLAAWRNGVVNLYVRLGGAWARFPINRLARLALLAREFKRRIGFRVAEVKGAVVNNKIGAYLPAAIPVLMTEDEAFRRLIRNSAPQSDFVPRRVILVCGNLAPGGAERQTANTLVGLKKAGLSDVSFLAHNLQPGPHKLDFHLTRVLAAGIPAREIRRVATATGDGGLPEEIHAARGGLPANLLVDIANLVHEFEAAKPEIVHTWLDWDGVRGGIAAAMAGVPRIIISGRNLAPYNFNLHQSYMLPAYKALASLPNVHFLNNSQAGADDYAQWIGIPPERISVIYNGLDFGDEKRLSDVERLEDRAALGLGPDDFVVGGVFRFSEEKRPLLWLDAAAQIVAIAPEIRFLIFGQGMMQGQIESRIQELGLAHHVKLAGVTQSPLRAMALMDVLLLTSFGEGLPNVLVEAQSVGTTVVCTRAGGAPEAVDNGRSGWVVDASAGEIAEAVIKLYRQPDLVRHARNSGPKFVAKKFGSERMVAETLATYSFEASVGFGPPQEGV